ncbi:CDP-diacylglycerol--glycerol-3-phosphate 3-phosphatidyltransferase [Oxobacter pfennigii]|uniref:CDP-diacylglycerol--glycerol-3-phosphate 3-phosphatidyltransferase n=1 Tax=Oxobacter pfennigii TaxID=36849 RepID=A0A0P8WKJ7_9CLOT|nr:CDP-diacylglycerol--glycerol-3-phosphate 3-phosphatidyltransferase [Oxobacter pfennigii]KPU42860.1 CDP-diacylglycerol--glycerol-3-phosphate 3-phosphatidyltransferase [Oxobacter pfennigii]
MNIPNLLTTLRFILVPVFLFVFFSDLPNAAFISSMIFIFAGFTDILDGYIARKFNMVTKWGTLLDPLADKLMALTVLISLTIKDIIPFWVPFIIGIKEGLMVIGGLILLKKGTYVSAASHGKMATVFFYISVLTLEFINRPLGLIFMYITVFAALFALYQYLFSFKKAGQKT